MKKRISKIAVCTLAATMLVPMVGFQKSPKTEFLFATNQLQQAKDVKMSIGVSDIKISHAKKQSKAEQKMEREMLSYVKKIKLSGESHENKRKEHLTIAKIHVGKGNIPIRMIQDKSKKRTFVSAEIYQGMIKFMKTIGVKMKEDATFVKKARGKYMDASNAKNGKFDFGFADVSSLKQESKIQKIYSSEVAKLLKSQKVNKYKIKGQIVSTTLDKASLLRLYKGIQNRVKKDRTLKVFKQAFDNDGYNALCKKGIDLRVYISINKKTKAMNTTLTYEQKRTKTEDGMKVSIKMNQQKIGKVNFHLPTKKEVLPTKEVEKAFDQLTPTVSLRRDIK